MDLGATLPFPQPVLLLGFVLAFTCLMFAGAQTFERDITDDLGAGLGQFSLLCTGALGASFAGRGVPIYVWNGAASAVVLVGALLLYEWARRIIRECRFHIAWSGRVPEALCERGPYAIVRHPVYLAYILAFLALLIALRTPVALAIFVFNAALYSHAAITDERSLAASPLADDYARYRRRVGMFVPRLGRRSDDEKPPRSKAPGR